jgi:hypothetical protein
MNRFEVDHKGMATLQAGREPWRLVKELVSNAFDEESSDTCQATITNIAPRQTMICITDNGTGFKDIKDAWTLMADTPKRRQATTRGRFNMGEKEILCVAIQGSITSNGTRVIFPKEGGRIIETCKPFAGVKVECLMPWGPKQAEEIVHNLKNLIPPTPEYKYLINGVRVKSADPLKNIQANLPTVLVDDLDGAIKFVTRKADIGIIKANGYGSWIYEMGIPVQPISCPWSVDIGQKVPMPPNRDTVRDSYLQKIYAVVLNSMASVLTNDQASDAWVRSAMESKTVDPSSIKAVVEKRYGKKVVMWSSDLDANQRARDNGYDVVHPRTLSPAEREMFKEYGMVPASQHFASSEAVTKKENTVAWEKYTPGMRLVTRFSERIADELNVRDVSVVIINEFGLKALATFGRGIIGSTLTFNLNKLGHAFFDQADVNGRVSKAVIDLVVHELSHIDGIGHDDVYQRELTEMAAKAVWLAIDKPEVYQVKTYKEVK